MSREHRTHMNPWHLIVGSLTLDQLNIGHLIPLILAVCGLWQCWIGHERNKHDAERLAFEKQRLAFEKQRSTPRAGASPAEARPWGKALRDDSPAS